MIDFKDLISRRDVLEEIECADFAKDRRFFGGETVLFKDSLVEAIRNIPSAFAEEPKKDPKGNRFEDIEKWEHENGIRKWKDRHHL